MDGGRRELGLPFRAMPDLGIAQAHTCTWTAAGFDELLLAHAASRGARIEQAARSSASTSPSAARPRCTSPARRAAARGIVADAAAAPRCSGRQLRTRRSDPRLAQIAVHGWFSGSTAAARDGRLDPRARARRAARLGLADPDQRRGDLDRCRVRGPGRPRPRRDRASASSRARSPRTRCSPRAWPRRSTAACRSRARRATSASASPGPAGSRSATPRSSSTPSPSGVSVAAESARLAARA